MKSGDKQKGAEAPLWCKSLTNPHWFTWASPCWLCW